MADVKKYCVVTKRSWGISSFPDVHAVHNAQINYNEIYGLNMTKYPAPYRGHKGTDYLVPSGTNIYGINGFKVNGINHKSSGLGNHIEIGNPHIAFIVAHLSKINVSVGQSVNTDMVIGLSGNTGISQGAHLHVQTWLNAVYYDEIKEK